LPDFVEVASVILAAVMPAADTLDAFYRALRALDGPGMMVIALLDSSLLSVPEANDLLIVGFSIGKPWSRVAYYVSMTTAGSVCGCLVLFTLGRRGANPLGKAWLSPTRRARVAQLFQKYGAFTLLVPSILPPPCPFKIFVFGAGVLGVPHRVFLTAIALGRLLRYSMWGILAVYFGPTVRDFMAERLWLVGVVLAAVLLAGLAALLLVHIRRPRNQGSPDTGRHGPGI
jgi:membrane protein YqaA with SNARE-associated domain